MAGGRASTAPLREDGYDITVASEIMAVLCLASDITDLKARLSRLVVGYTYDEKPVTAGDLNAQGAMTALLKDALKPNLVQTLEHTGLSSTAARCQHRPWLQLRHRDEDRHAPVRLTPSPRPASALTWVLRSSSTSSAAWPA